MRSPQRPAAGRHLGVSPAVPEQAIALKGTRSPKDRPQAAIADQGLDLDLDLDFDLDLDLDCDFDLDLDLDLEGSSVLLSARGAGGLARDVPKDCRG
jgi:hypothetical protein